MKGEGDYVFSDARPFKSGHISVPVTNGYDCPGISTRCQHYVHQEAAHSTVAVHVEMNVDKDKVSQDDAYRWVSLFSEKIKEAGIASRKASGLSGTCIDFRM
jgi:hypothetical protein